ncbi:MAG: hypothetical protein KAJ19_24150 [Gammaproteobacteria bacterium]|nr:hypothetical protein [Gammaproteobacteria bacterium]
MAIYGLWFYSKQIWALNYLGIVLSGPRCVMEAQLQGRLEDWKISGEGQPPTVQEIGVLGLPVDNKMLVGEARRRREGVI